ncbi:putative holin-like toxin [Brevibacillus laterosporus]|nr:putative holin-like toxin [Brevibacillus laterosporus]
MQPMHAKKTPPKLKGRLFVKPCYNLPCTVSRLDFLKGGRLTSLYPINREGGENMEVYQALTLMLMFGMFILALLTYLKKK